MDTFVYLMFWLQILLVLPGGIGWFIHKKYKQKNAELKALGLITVTDYVNGCFIGETEKKNKISFSLNGVESNRKFAAPIILSCGDWMDYLSGMYSYDYLADFNKRVEDNERLANTTRV